MCTGGGRGVSGVSAGERDFAYAGAAAGRGGYGSQDCDVFAVAAFEQCGEICGQPGRKGAPVCFGLGRTGVRTSF